MIHKQKRKSEDKGDRHLKKFKSESVSQGNELDSKIDLLDVKPDILDAKSIREGLVVLGCITYIGKSSIRMSLPGCLHGNVESFNISNGFTKAVESSAEYPDTEMPSIESVVKVGMTLPCKVVNIQHGTDSHKKMRILLSIKPEDINGDLKPSSLFIKMGLFVSVESIEDHGYVLDVGTEAIKGFLPKQNSDTKEELKIGQLIPVYAEKIVLNKNKSAKVTFYRLSFSHQQFPEVPLKDEVKLHSILPGARISADVIKKHRHYAILKCFNFDACASLFYRGFSKAIKEGGKVKGTVLYICPVTRLIHLSIDDLPSPDDFSDYFKMRKLEMVNSPKFLYFFKNQAIFCLDHGKFGFINVWDLPSKTRGKATMPSLAITDIEKARIVSLHFMDNVIQLSAKLSVLKQDIILRENIKAGDVYDIIVEKHTAGGMFVHICPGVLGFVRKVHISDAFVTKPEQLYPVGITVKCKVLYNNGEGKIYLTSKKSLVELDADYMLPSYWDARKNHIYKGVVVNVSKEYILVLFFNEVKGIMKRGHMPFTDPDTSLNTVYFEGQTIACKVLHCDPRERKLFLSHQIDDLNQKKNYLLKLHDIPVNQKHVNSKKRKHSCESEHVISEIVEANISDDDNKAVNLHETTTDMQYTSPELCKAVIRKVKGHQLNISLNDGKGRVHVTQLECMAEGIYPLKNFLSGQEINVYVIGQFKQKRQNFLEITHRNMATFKECTLKFPPRPSDFVHGDSVMGFIRQAHDIYATVWLSPAKFGVLDYLHYSDNPKVIRKLRQYLKLGLSLNVSVLDIKQGSAAGKVHPVINLTKIDYSVPEAGKSVVGLIQVVCPSRGFIMKLPFGYHGNVAITDLSDVYEPVQNLFKRYQKLKFLKCHVLKVDHETKYCWLSLRMSRLYQKKTNSDSFCPEITLERIEEGDEIKGYVKHASFSNMTVLIGREIEGKINLHECKLNLHCKACKKTKQIIGRFPPGSVIDVIIEGKLSQKEFILSLPEMKSKKNSFHVLPIEEDITFDFSVSNDAELNSAMTLIGP